MNQTQTIQPKEKLFTSYQIFMIAVLAFLQFTVILDFMVLSPLSVILMKDMHLSAEGFGWVVSGYAFSAGASGILAAGFADKFDRKSLLLFFYVGFLFGTLLCAVANSYWFLLIARIITGIFGGVIGSIGFAIITDLFKPEVRGRVMGFVQMSFSASQILGVPVGFYLANKLEWHAPFWMIVIFGIAVGLVIFFYMKPITAHLEIKNKQNALEHLTRVLSKSFYLKAFAATALLATGGFMLMPFGSAYSTHNLGINTDQVTLLYFITGISSLLSGPLIGNLSDKIGKFTIFATGSVVSIAIVNIYTNLGITPLWICAVLNIIMFAGIMARMISASAMTSLVPSLPDRGAYMSISSSLQQIAGGIAAYVAGKIVIKTPSGYLERYDVLGYVVIGTMVVAIGLIYWLDQQLKNREKNLPETPGNTMSH
jgi:multidrug resistance protein